MVDGLAARLKTNGKDLEGWMRLVRSYMVLGRREEAVSALSSARGQFSGDAEFAGRAERPGRKLGARARERARKGSGMTRKQRRGVLIGVGVAVLTLAVGLVLFALRDSIVFFHTPSDLADKPIAGGQRFRLGGLVAAGSVKRGEGTKVQFAVTDTLKTVPVSYEGVLPDLFKEGQGVVAEGKLSPGRHVRRRQRARQAR